jgi:hypothetical protein
VDWITQVASRLFDAYVALFGGAPRWVSLCPLSVAGGVVTLWIFHLTSKPKAIRRAKQLLMAYLLEMRLYGDEPAMVLRAQWRLLGANARYLALMLVPLVCAGIVLLPLLAQMERYYGRGPLQPGRAALFTVQLRGPVDGSGEPPHLEAPEGIRVETPAVRVAAENRVVWRIRAEAEASGVLRAAFTWGAVEKRVEAGARRPVVPRRVSSVVDLMLHPGEGRIVAGPVAWAEIEYPDASVPLFGIPMHWTIVFLVFSLPTALFLKRRFGVVF